MLLTFHDRRQDYSQQSRPTSQDQRWQGGGQVQLPLLRAKRKMRQLAVQRSFLRLASGVSFDWGLGFQKVHRPRLPVGLQAELLETGR